MAETTADVRRDIELTRERMSSTIAELERKLNVMQVVRDHPWPAIAVAAGAGFLLGGSGADVKAASAAAAGSVAATRGVGSRLGPLLDDLMARVISGVHDTLEQRADELVDELKRAIGAPSRAAARAPAPTQSRASGAAGSAATDAWRPAHGTSHDSGGAAFHGESRERTDGATPREQPPFAGPPPSNAPRAD